MIVSSSAPPNIASLPFPASILSFPSLLNIVSLPESPSIESAPVPPSRDDETGQTALGKEFIGFTRFTRDADYAAEYFGKKLAETLSDNAELKKRLGGYTHLTQVLSRSRGDASVNEVFARLLPLDKISAKYRKDPPERALGTITAKMAREGTNKPEWKLALVINVPPIVDEIQGPGRVRRKVGDELSIVLDCLAELDGKILGNPCLYHVAIDDPSVVRGAVTVVPPPEDLANLGSDILEFKDKEEFKTLVLGEGTARTKLEGKFDKLWGQIEKHTFRHAANPVPYMLDGDPVKCKLVISYKQNKDEEEIEGKGKKGFRISVSAVDQFRREFGIPGQTSSLWLDGERLDDAVLGSNKGAKASYYGPAYEDLVAPVFKHIRGNTSGVANYPNPKIDGKEVRGEMRLNNSGDLVPALHSSAVQVIKEKLDMLPYKSRKFLNRSEFEALVFYGVKDPKKYQRNFNKAWEEATDYYRKNHKPGQLTKFDVGGTRVLVSDCINDGEKKELCIERKGVRAFQRLLGIPEIQFDVDGIDHEKDFSAVEKITKLLNGFVYPSREEYPEYKSRGEITEKAEVKAVLDRLAKEYDEIEKDEKGIASFKHNNNIIKAIKLQSLTQTPICFHEVDVSKAFGFYLIKKREEYPEYKLQREINNRAEVKAALGKFAEEYDSADKDEKGIASFKYNNNIIKAIKLQPSNPAIYFHEVDVSKAFGKKREEYPEYKTIRELSRKAEVESVLDKFVEEYDEIEKDKNGFASFKHNDKIIKAIKLHSGPKIVVCFREVEVLEAFGLSFDAKTESKAPKGLKKKPPEKKDLKPGSLDLKRTGFSGRGKKSGGEE